MFRFLLSSCTAGIVAANHNDASVSLLQVSAEKSVHTVLAHAEDVKDCRGAGAAVKSARQNLRQGVSELKAAREALKAAKGAVKSLRQALQSAKAERDSLCPKKTKKSKGVCSVAFCEEQVPKAGLDPDASAGYCFGPTYRYNDDKPKDVYTLWRVSSPPRDENAHPSYAEMYQQAKDVCLAGLDTVVHQHEGRVQWLGGVDSEEFENHPSYSRTCWCEKNCDGFLCKPGEKGKVIVTSLADYVDTAVEHLSVNTNYKQEVLRLK